jgi:Ca2+-binding RTX toxin-like protein
MVGGSEDDTYYVDNTGDQVIEKLEADGVGSYDTVISSISYTAPEFVEAVFLTGSANINATASSGGCDLTGNSGSNYLKGGDGLDFIFGDEGADTLEGGAGDDYYYLTGNEDTVIEQAGGGLDQIWAYGDGITMAANVERLYMMSFLARTATGNDGNNLMQGNNRANTLYGKGGNDKLLSGAGDDTLYGGVGNDSLYGSTGNDTYHFSRGDGADMISDFDATVGNQDKLMFDGAIDSSQLWLTKSGNDLVVSVIGTTDKVTISSWYLSSTYQVENIVAGGNSKTLSAANVQNLVNAMASFTPPAQGQTTLPSNYQTALGSVIAANWT